MTEWLSRRDLCASWAGGCCGMEEAIKNRSGSSTSLTAGGNFNMYLRKQHMYHTKLLYALSLFARIQSTPPCCFHVLTFP